MIHRLSSTRERCMSENRAGFRPDRGCTETNFHFETDRKTSKITVDPWFSSFFSFESSVRVSRSWRLWQCFSQKFISFFQSRFANSRSRVCAQANVPSESTTISTARLSLLLSLSLPSPTRSLCPLYLPIIFPADNTPDTPNDSMANSVVSGFQSATGLFSSDNGLNLDSHFKTRWKIQNVLMGL